MKIQPTWAMGLLPPQFIAGVAELERIKAQYRLTHEQMEQFIEVGKRVPIPVVQVVEGLASGELLIHGNKLYSRDVYEAMTGEKPPDKPVPLTVVKRGEVIPFPFPKNGKAPIYGPDGKPV